MLTCTNGNEANRELETRLPFLLLPCQWSGRRHYVFRSYVCPSGRHWSCTWRRNIFQPRVVEYPSSCVKVQFAQKKNYAKYSHKIFLLQMHAMLFVSQEKIQHFGTSMLYFFSDPPVSDERVEEMCRWLQHNIEPTSTVLQYMRATSGKRLNDIRSKDKSLDQILQTWPRLLDSPGMVCNFIKALLK